MVDYQALLDEAREYLNSRDSIRNHPLKNTHVNDIPVIMANFCADKLCALEPPDAHTGEVAAAFAALDSAVFESTKATKPHRHAALATVSEAIHTLHAHVERLGHELTAAKRALEPHENAGVVPTGATGRGEK